MKQGWRWYGDADAITLKEIRQAGVTDIVAALYERKPGEVWPVAEIKARAKKVKDAGMVWSVVESVPIHEDIKKHTGNYLKYVENYKKTLRNLAKCGIKTVCYNFMPVLDWTRSNLEYQLPDGLYITAVTKGSDAEAKGIVPGDIITAVNGEPAKTSGDILKVRDSLAVGDTITFTIWREGRTFDVDVALVERNDVY